MPKGIRNEVSALFKEIFKVTKTSNYKELHQKVGIINISDLRRVNSFHIPMPAKLHDKLVALGVSQAAIDAHTAQAVTPYKHGSKKSGTKKPAASPKKAVPQAPAVKKTAPKPPVPKTAGAGSQARRDSGFFVSDAVLSACRIALDADKISQIHSDDLLEMQKIYETRGKITPRFVRAWLDLQKAD